VIVPNVFLKEYASRFNKCVYIIPTPIDTGRFKITERSSDKLTIGWIGSFTTAPYLKTVFNVMRRLSEKYDFILKIFGAGEIINIPGVRVENYDWNLEKEVEYFQSIDIGIYPLTDTLWARGKAGFKAIQYMAVGIPVVASSIGMNKEIIQDGVSGFLVSSDQEWFDRISRLIEDSALRKKMGFAGREAVEEKYSVKINAPKYIKIIKGK
jgi:glycosyltransferase involved in cell wall biosynthesis